MVFKIATLSLAFFWAFTPAMAQDDCAGANSLAQRGMDVFDQDSPKGLELLNQALAACPGSWPIAYDLGLAYYRSGQLAVAYDKWKALESRAGGERLFVNLGWLALELGKADEAAAWLKKREKAGSPDASSLALTMEVLFAQGKFDAALDLSFTDIRYVPLAYRQKAVDRATEDAWNIFRSGKTEDAIARMAELSHRFPEVKSLDMVRDIMVAALLDNTVVIPPPKQPPPLPGGLARNQVLPDEAPWAPPASKDMGEDDDEQK